MKAWTSLALATLLGVSNAVRLSGKYTSDPKLTARIMENAQYYSGGDRELNDAGAEFQITAAHTILFRSCESLSVHAEFGNGNDDGISEQIKSMYQAGTVKAQKSYIVFDVCLSQYCDSGNAKDRTSFITDMASFINALLQFIPEKTQAYCQGCFANQDYCTAVYQKTYATSSKTYANGGYRSLQQNGNIELVEEIDCNQCKNYGCFTGDYANVDYSLEWIQSMTQCKRSENPVYYQGAEITTGFMCNQAGDGVEIAGFLDQDCTLYTNQVAYGNMLTESEYNYWYNSKTHIEYMFNVGYSCYNPSILYTNAYDAQSGAYDNIDVDENYAPQAADYCTNVFQGSSIGVVQVGTCSGYSSNAAAVEEDFQQVYTLAEEDAYDGYAVCAALTGRGGSGEHLYEKSSSGSMYKYSGGAKTQIEWERAEQKKTSRRRGLIASLVLLSIAAVVGGLYMYRKKQNESQKEKKIPLVDTMNEAPTLDDNATAYA